MFDCQSEGDDGAKEAAWKLLQRNVVVRTAWSQTMHGGRFAGRETESVTAEELRVLLHVAPARGAGTG